MKAIIILLVFALFSLIIIDAQQGYNTNVLCDFTYPELEQFLISDSTNEFKMKSDRFMTTTLSEAAYTQGYNMGIAILGSNQTFKTGQLRIINYVYIDSDYIFINPHNDILISLEDIIMRDEYKYIKLYSNGTELPVNLRNESSQNVELYDLL
jgi:hypothetical protein